MKVVATYAGCTPRNNMVVRDGCHVLFGAGSSIVGTDGGRVARASFLEDDVNCLAVRHGVLAVGDIGGRAYVFVPDREVRCCKLSTNVQACVPLSAESVVFCTLDAVHLYDCEMSLLASCAVGALPTCVDAHEGVLYMGASDGRIYAYGGTGSGFGLLAKTAEEAHADRVRAIRVSDGGCIATGGQDGTVKLWAFEDGVFRCMQILVGHEDWVNSLEWSGSVLYSASSDKTARVWKREAAGGDEEQPGAERAFVSYKADYLVGGSSEFMSVCAVGDRFYVHSRTGGIDVFSQSDDAGLQFCNMSSGHTAEITDLDWNANMLLTSSLDYTSRIFYKGKEAGRVQVHGWPIIACKFQPGSMLRVVSGAAEPILRIYQGTQSFLGSCRHIEEHCLEESSDAEEKARFRLDGDDDSFDEHSSSSSEETGEAEEPCAAQCEIERQTYGNMDVTAEDEQTLDAMEYVASAYLSELDLTPKLADEVADEGHSECAIATNVFEEVQKIYGHFYDVSAIAVTKQFIFSANRSMSKNEAGLFMWTRDGEKLQYYPHHSLGIARIKATEDAVLTVSRDRSACLYTIRNQHLNLVKQFKDHTRAVLDGGLSPDRRLFATCSKDCKVILYSRETLDTVAVRTFPFEVTALDFCPGGELIAVGLSDGTVHLMDYDLEIYEHEHVFGKRVTVLKFNKSGRRLAAGSADGLVRIIKVCEEDEEQQ
ncbi:elongator complex protein 2 [Pancytospora philotis]|nr:elongator complex protein 2 [Pancytospora philotis]